MIGNRQPIAKQDDRSQTRADIRKGKGGNQLVIGKRVLIFNGQAFSTIGSRARARSSARVRDSFPRISRTKTVGSSTPHQRSRQGLRQPVLPTQCPHDRPAYGVTPAFAAALSIDHMIENHMKGDLRGRSLMTFNTLGRKEARARPGDRCNVRIGEMHREGPDHLSKSRGGGGDSAARPIIDLLIHFRGRFSQDFFGPKKIRFPLFRRGPVLKKLFRVEAGIPTTRRTVRQDSETGPGFAERLFPAYGCRGARIHRWPSGGRHE
jgi:hypothetical protein